MIGNKEKTEMTKVTNITIGQPCPVELILNCFVLETTFMHGDADQFTTGTLTFDLNEKEELLRAINFINACIEAYPSGRGGSDSYECLNLEHYEEFGDFLEYDVTGSDSEATVEDLSVTYYDNKGVAHFVEFN